MPEKTLTEVFTDIADAIREKTGGAEPIAALDMATAISEIPSGPALEEGLYYVDENQEIDSISLSAGIYEYVSGSDFYSENNISDYGLYYYGSSTPHFSPATGGNLFWSAPPEYENWGAVTVNNDSVYKAQIDDEGEITLDPVTFPSTDGIYLYNNNTFSEAIRDSSGVPEESGCYWWSAESAYFQAEEFEDYVVYRYEGGGYFNNLEAEADNLYWYNDSGLASALEDGVTLEDGNLYAWSDDHKAFSAANVTFPEINNHPYLYLDNDFIDMRPSGELVDGDLYTWVADSHYLVALDTEKMYGYSTSGGHWAAVDIPEGAVTWNAASGYFEPAGSGDDITADLDSGSDYFLTYDEYEHKWTAAEIPSGYRTFNYDAQYHDLKPFEEIYSEDDLFNNLFAYIAGSGFTLDNTDDALGWAYTKLQEDYLNENKTYTLAYNNDDGHWTITEN